LIGAFYHRKRFRVPMIEVPIHFLGGNFMSIHRAGKRLSWLGLSALLVFAVPNFSWAQESCGPFVGALSCGPKCHGHCPPALKYIYEGGPKIHWHCGCPHPICNPCDLPNWGYHETCWTPWPFAPNWSHCPTPPPAAFVQLNPFANMNPQGAPPVRTTPAPPQNLPLRLPPTQPQPSSDDLPSPRRFN